MILILSSPSDSLAGAVVGHLEAFDVDVLRLDLAQTPPGYVITAEFDRETNRQTYELSQNGKKIDLASVTAVWWRHPGPSAFTATALPLADILTALDVFWVNRFNREDEAEGLAYQLKTARELNLKLPDTLITGDQAAAQDFIDLHGLENIVRRTFLAADRKWLETPLPPEGIGPVDTLAPVILQERSLGTDLRITILDETFTDDFDGPKLFGGTQEWERVKARLEKFVRRLGLSYGTIHLRLAAGETEAVFLDLSPLGEADSQTTKIATKVATFLQERDEKVTRGPLGEIALSLSGGGYRAAAFHLGTMHMLDRLGVLKDVTRLSSASGGTITAAKYLHDMQGVTKLPFAKFFENMKEFLALRNIITEAITNLEKTRTVNGNTLAPSLVRGAAAVYASKELVGNTTLGEILDSPREIKKVFFNSTNFHTATNFRFEINDVSVKIPDRPGKEQGKKETPKEAEDRRARRQEALRSIRLADVVAASACFPGGLEPIYFPTDFVWPEPLDAIRKSLGFDFAKDDLPLMDGGIFDNQGIDSIKVSLGRKDSSTDLFIISDSSARDDRLFDRKPEPNKCIVKLWMAALGIAIVFLAALGSVATLGYSILNKFCLCEADSELFLFYLPPFFIALLVAAAVPIAIFMIRPHWPVIKEKIGGGKGWAALARLSVSDLIELVSSRVLSVLKLVMSVFLDRVRSTGFTSVFSDANLNKTLLPNLIYDLAEPERWEKKLPKRFYPIESLGKFVKGPEEYPTTLDFDGQKNARLLNDLIETGRITMCFNILRYLYQYKSAEIRTKGSVLATFARKVEKIWMTECNKPKIPGKWPQFP